MPQTSEEKVQTQTLANSRINKGNFCSTTKHTVYTVMYEPVIIIVIIIIIIIIIHLWLNFKGASSFFGL